MLKKERHAHIIRQVNLHNKVLSSDLAIELNVSEDTIRRDLNELDSTGQIVKVHGGALSRSYHYPFQQNNIYAADAKQLIVTKAIGLLKEDMVVLTGGGTTILEMATMLPKDLPLTVFTISPPVALQLADHPMVKVILIGGEMSKESQVCTGADAVSYLNDMRFDICFLGTNGISPTEGVTDSDLSVVQVKKAMIKASKRTVIICIAEKLNSVQRMKVCGLQQINSLITELDPANEALVAYQRAGLNLY